jgi:hypothetical protein
MEGISTHYIDEAEKSLYFLFNMKGASKLLFIRYQITLYILFILNNNILSRASSDETIFIPEIYVSTEPDISEGLSFNLIISIPIR